MIKPLRKRHLQTWLVLMVLMPAGIISAILVRPGTVAGHLLQPAAVSTEDGIIKTIEKINFTVNLRGHDHSVTELEWINKEVLTVPTAVIYKIHPLQKGIDSSRLLIGRIEARGDYHFALRPDPAGDYHFILYDFIHQQIIDSINFQP